MELVEHLELELKNRRERAADDRKRAALTKESSTLKVPSGNNERVWLLEMADKQDRMAELLEKKYKSSVPPTTLFD